MGSYLSRNGNDEVEEIDPTALSPYIYPPKSGSYFGTHFYLGGNKFEVAQPEAFLFGDNSDLNHLGPRPYDLPYQCPEPSQPIRALKCLINIRKDSLRLIRVPNPPSKPTDDVINTSPVPPESSPKASYNIEFTFDSDCPCSIAIYYNCSEEMKKKSVIYKTKSANSKSDVMHFNAGANQQFCLPSHVIDPASLNKVKSASSLQWDPHNIPIAIQACAECGPMFSTHSHIAFATFEKVSDETWNMKLTKQKQAINGVCYLFQEIYGIENKKKSPQDGDADMEEDDEDNAECVVCLSDARDTIILPCKHLCLCSSCANQLRYQQSGCPICRQSFRALLQIRAVKKKQDPASNDHVYQTVAEVAEEDGSIDTEGDENSENSPLDVSIPPGYEVVPLITALNGPPSTCNTSQPGQDGGRAQSELSRASSNSSRRKKSNRRKKSKIKVENEINSRDDRSHGNEQKSQPKEDKRPQMEERCDEVTNASSAVEVTLDTPMPTVTEVTMDMTVASSTEIPAIIDSHSIPTSIGAADVVEGTACDVINKPDESLPLDDVESYPSFEDVVLCVGDEEQHPGGKICVGDEEQHPGGKI